MTLVSTSRRMPATKPSESRMREIVRRENGELNICFRRREPGRSASGSTILPDGESLMGQEHDGKAGV